jgi:hypothetical protein
MLFSDMLSISDRSEIKCCKVWSIANVSLPEFYFDCIQAGERIAPPDYTGDFLGRVFGITTPTPLF